MQENSHYRQLNAACCKFEKSQKIILVAKEFNWTGGTEIPSSKYHFNVHTNLARLFMLEIMFCFEHYTFLGQFPCKVRPN